MSTVRLADQAMRERLRVGGWLVDPETNELRRGNDVVRIEPKAMDLLVALAERAGSVVSRDQLFAAVWPGVVVGDEALTQSIIKLRRALGDDSRAPAYIETISKRGYRLIAPVTRADDSAPDAARPPRMPTLQEVKPALPTRRTASIVAVAVAFVLGIGYYASDRSIEPALRAIDGEESRPDSWVTIAVLPFEALGADDRQGHVARGIGDNLLTDLSRLSGLRVIRASGSGTGVAPSGARYRVSGSVQRDADTLRVNVHLVDAATQEQLWAGRFERPAGELFALQDEIVAKVVELLPAKVSEIERTRLAKRYTHSLEAYDQFLRGQALFLVRRDEDNDGARGFYRKAVELDPKFARAYASLAMTHAMDYRLRDTGRASLERAFELAETARLIDPEIPEVHWALGFVHTQSRRHEQAIESLRRAIQLDGSFADAYALLAGTYTYVGQPAKSIPLLRTAMRLNPDAGYLYFLVAGRAYLFANDVEQAIINLRAALLRNPIDVETRILLAAALAAAGDERAASWEADEIRSLARGFSASRWLDIYPMTDARQRERLASWLAGAGL